jgi:hypothetical protein
VKKERAIESDKKREETAVSEVYRDYALFLVATLFTLLAFLLLWRHRCGGGK